MKTLEPLRDTFEKPGQRRPLDGVVDAQMTIEGLIHRAYELENRPAPSCSTAPLSRPVSASPGHDLAETIRLIHFWWEDGNGACDCNKHLFFCRAIGEPDAEDVACVQPDGSRLYTLVDLLIEVTEEGK